MKNQRRFWSFLGKLLVSLFFIWCALYKLFWWHEVDSQMTADICNWHLFTTHIPWLENATESILPLVSYLHGFVIAMLFAGAGMLLSGWHSRMGTVILLIYTLFDSVFSHYFWMLEGVGRHVELTMFMQNMAIMGALILILVQGKVATADERFASIPLPGENFGNE